MPPSKPPPLLDRVHLDTQTFGDTALAHELLGLFAGQCGRVLPALLDAARPAAERADLAHTLQGSGLGVGAARVAALSAQIEDAFRARGEASATLLDALADAVAATLSQIAATRGAIGAGEAGLR